MQEPSTENWNAFLGGKPKNKTVLFVPVNSIGHVNSLIGIANALKKRGHRTVFLYHEPMICELQKAGHEVYDCTSEGLIPSQASLLDRNEMMEKALEIMKNPTNESVVGWIKYALNFLKANIIKNDPIFARKLALIKPDVLILDQYYAQPSILKYGKPWSLIYSVSPLGLHPKEHNLPPEFLGIPTNWMQMEDSDERKRYHEIAKLYSQMRNEVFADWIKYLHEEHQIVLGASDYESCIQLSSHLNVYMYPEELDYEQKLDKWIRCDSLLRNVVIDNHVDDEKSREDIFDIPAQLCNKPGKLIYLSMGTLASISVDLMKRMIEILSKCPHRFIVSMGTNWNKYDLAPNMWGQRYVDQLSILPLIDLMITHGGNNTITECFYYGVPGFIVCPAFADQKDNAQRIEECKLGKRIDPFNCDEKQFLEAIEEVLADETIRPRMRAISERMHLPENKYKAIRLFAQFVEDTYN